jgi:hypothetical protein
MKIMKCILLTTFTLFLFNISAFSQDIITKEINNVKDSLADTLNASKHILTPPKMAKNKIEKSLSKINSECCEENFKYKKDLFEIKDTFENCLNKKCQNYMIPLFSVKKPPLKIISLRQIDLVDTLLLENEKQKYENLVLQMDLDSKNNEMKNEKNIQIVKDQLLLKEKENKKLKKTVNKMLTNYQKKISVLQKEKLALEENFNLVFESHSKAKQKKLSKKLN